jgi:hypothetical protein
VSPSTTSGSDDTALYGNMLNTLGDWGLYTPDDIFVGGDTPLETR